MFIFRRHKHTEADTKKEAEVQAIRKETFRKIDKSNKSSEKLIRLLESNVAENIFIATGGKRRSRK
jgi:hypothetical protein